MNYTKPVTQNAIKKRRRILKTFRLSVEDLDFLERTASRSNLKQVRIIEDALSVYRQTRGLK